MKEFLPVLGGKWGKTPTNRVTRSPGFSRQRATTSAGLVSELTGMFPWGSLAAKMG